MGKINKSGAGQIMNESKNMLEILSGTSGMFFLLWLNESASTEPVSLRKSIIVGLAGIMLGIGILKSGFLDN